MRVHHALARSYLAYAFKRTKPPLPCLFNYDGKVSICCRDTMQGAVVGDINESSLLDIWNGPIMVGMRELMVAKKYDHIGICRNCDRVWTGGYSGGSPLRMALIFIMRKIRSLGWRSRE